VLTYAIGDVHGCLGLLDTLLGSIAENAAGRDHRLVFLGDYIDRGPDSAGVLARLRELQVAAPDRVVCLKGNHEDLMLRALKRPDNLGLWLDNGGDAALASFGCRDLDDVPRDVTAWIAGCQTWFEDEWRIFVHAGMRPGRDPREQTDRDRLWIRETFLLGDHDFGKYVVHGHTPQKRGEPDCRPHRVNLDTAAVYGGRLTAGIFMDDQAAPVGFLQVPAKAAPRL
jgi:serine/threonine protein phosphatase 1